MKYQWKQKPLETDMSIRKAESEIKLAWIGYINQLPFHGQGDEMAVPLWLKIGKNTDKIAIF